MAKVILRKALWPAVAVVVLGIVAYLLLKWSEAPPRMYNVTGVVTVDGKPAEGVSVCFWPALMKKRDFNFRTGVGISDSQGRFTITSSSGNEGLGSGEYKVTFSRRMFRGKSVVGATKVSGAVESIPEAYREPEQTPLSATVSDKQTDFSFNVPSK